MSDRARTATVCIIAALFLIGYLLWLSTTRPPPVQINFPNAPPGPVSNYIAPIPNLIPTPTPPPRVPQCILFDPNADVNRCVMYGG